MMMKSVLVGFGYWGRILVKYIRQSDQFELTGICDPGLENSPSLDAMLKECRIECAFVCVPVRRHYEIVHKLLEYNVHVFCEKPLCSNLKDTLQLYRLAWQKERVLFTDYIYTVSPSIRYMKDHINMLGEIRYINMDIKQFGRFYKEENVYEVIGVHMISVLVFLFGMSAQDDVISAVDTLKYNKSGKAEAGILFFKIRGVRGKIECSLISEEKIRRIEVICENGMIVFDMLKKDTVKMIYHQEDTKTGQKIQQTLEAKQFDEKNNLCAAVECFGNAVLSGKSEFDQLSLQTARILEQIKGGSI